MSFARARRAALLCWTPAVAGCSAWFDFTVEQCKFDADCSTSGALRCEQGLCVPRTDCERNSDCSPRTADEAQICVDARCQTLLPPRAPCFARYPSNGPVRDQAIVLGAFGTPHQTNVVQMPLLNYELAISELNGQGGLDGRQVVLVVCDNGYRFPDSEEGTVMSGFEHLTETLRVPAIVAGLNSARAVQKVFPRDGIEAPFFLVPFASDGSIVDDDYGLIRYLLNTSDDARALVALAQRVERGLQQRGLAERANVVAWRGSGQTAASLWASLRDPLSEAYPLQWVEASSRDALGELVAAKPQIVLVVDGEDFIERLGELESRWQEQWPDRERPVYLLPPHFAGSTALLAHFEAAPHLDAARFAGLHARHRGDPEILARYVERFAARFPATSGAINGWNYYDAVYYLAYAAFAGTPKGNVGTLTASQVQQGFSRLTQGEEVEIGPENIASAVTALSKRSITFVGVLGPAAFQPWDGMPTEGGAAVFCLTREQGTVSYRYDVLVYDDDSGQLDPGDNVACSDLLAQANAP